MDLNGEVLYNLSAGLGFIAYLMTNVMWLRMVLVVGAIFYIVTGLTLGLSSMVGWHVGYALINLGHIAILHYNNSAIGLAEPARTIYSSRFTALRPREFQRLLNINRSVQIEDGVVMSDGQDNRKLMLITAGEVAVSKHGEEVTRLGVGDFIGEMSVLTGNPVSAEVAVTRPLEYRYWTLEDMKKLEIRQLSLYNRFMMVIGRNLVDKLRVATETRVGTPV